MTIVKKKRLFLNCKPHTVLVHLGLTVSHLQQFVEMCNVTFLRLLLGDLRLFEMDVFVVKCLQEDE